MSAVPAFVEARRSIRAFRADPVPRADLDAIVEAACLAPAPHHSRPWRFVVGCLTWNGLDRYPDERRQRAEWGMALLSLGAAVENLMLTATDRGLASCWVAAPIFCPEEARDALSLPVEWLPHALVLVGLPDPAYVGRTRPPVPLDEIRRFAH